MSNLESAIIHEIISKSDTDDSKVILTSFAALGHSSKVSHVVKYNFSPKEIKLIE